MQSPLASIILPTFERLQYLRLTVDCVHRQTCSDWELIVSDDGSGADTREYLRTLASDARVKLVWLPHSGIPAVVRNAALRVATGQYVAFLDSDDLWAPQKLARQLDVLQARPACRWSYTGFSQIDGDGRPLVNAPHGTWLPYEGSIFERLVVGPLLPIRTPAVLAERGLIEQAGGFDESIRSGEDYDLWLRLALRSEAAVVDEALVQVRRHEHNHSHDWESAFVGRDYSLAKLQRAVDPERRSLLRSERTRNALRLAATHASLGNHARMVRALWQSLPYSWVDPRWWYGLLKIPVRPHVPQVIVDAYRRRRRNADAS
jgi:glycosyltransferase involved in cell wall biosynthesis